MPKPTRAKKLRLALQQDFDTIQRINKEAKTSYLTGVMQDMMRVIEKCLESDAIESKSWTESTGSCGWVNPCEFDEYDYMKIVKGFNKESK